MRLVICCWVIILLKYQPLSIGWMCPCHRKGAAGLRTTSLSTLKELQVIRSSCMQYCISRDISIAWHVACVETGQDSSNLSTLTVLFILYTMILKQTWYNNYHVILSLLHLRRVKAKVTGLHQMLNNPVLLFPDYPSPVTPSIQLGYYLDPDNNHFFPNHQYFLCLYHWRFF